MNSLSLISMFLFSLAQSYFNLAENASTPDIETIDEAKIPLTFFYLTDQSSMVCNDNGQMINASLSEKNPKAWLCGGPTCTDRKNQNDFYEYSFTKYYVAEDSIGYSGNLTKNALIVIEEYWFKQSYGSCEEAKHHRNGMVKTIFCVGKQKHYTNEAFGNFTDIIKKITQPNSCTTTTLLDTFVWFREWYLKNVDARYMYWRGTYKDAVTNRKYHCAIDFFFPVFGDISEDQWFQFATLLRNSQHQRLANKVPKYPKAHSPIVKHGSGQVQILLAKADLVGEESEPSTNYKKKIPWPLSVIQPYRPSHVITTATRIYDKLLPLLGSLI